MQDIDSEFSAKIPSASASHEDESTILYNPSPISPNFLFSSLNSPTFDHHFSTPTDPSYPSLFDYSSNLYPTDQLEQLATTVVPTCPIIRTDSTVRQTDSTATNPTTDSRWTAIARDAQALRDRWTGQNPIMQNYPSAPLTPTMTPRPTRVEFADRTLNRSQSTPPERRSSIRFPNLSSPTAATVDNPTQTGTPSGLWAHLSVNDSTLTPQRFSGQEKAAEKAERWLEYFLSYTAFRNITGLAKLQLFKLLMADRAADWLRSLEAQTLTDLDLLMEAFRKRFALTDIDRWRKAANFQSRCQQTSESVDNYISDMKNMAGLIPIKDPALLRFTIVKGLRAPIRLHVLQSGAQTLSEVIQAAKVAEGALAASAESGDDIVRLTDKVNELLTKIDIKPLVSSTADNSVSGRKVSFATLENDRETRQYTPQTESLPLQPRTQRDNQQRLDRSPSFQRRQFLPNRQQSNNDRSRWPAPNNSTTMANRYNNSSWNSSSGQENRQMPRDQYRPQQRSFSTPPSTRNNCNNCGINHQPGRFSCPANNQSCFRCNRPGHFSRCCRSSNRPGQNFSS